LGCLLIAKAGLESDESRAKDPFTSAKAFDIAGHDPGDHQAMLIGHRLVTNQD